MSFLEDFEPAVAPDELPPEELPQLDYERERQALIESQSPDRFSPTTLAGAERPLTEEEWIGPVLTNVDPQFDPRPLPEAIGMAPRLPQEVYAEEFRRAALGQWRQYLKQGR